MLGKIKPLLKNKRTTLAHLQATYLQLLEGDGAGEEHPEAEPEAEPEPEPEPGRGDDGPGGGGGGAGAEADGGRPSLTREEVQALAGIGDIGVVLSGAAVEGGAPVRGQLRRSQGRRNGKVLTEGGQVVWFAFADVEAGTLRVARG